MNVLVGNLTEGNVVLLCSFCLTESDFSRMPAGDVSFYQCSQRVIEDRFCPCVNNAVVFLEDSSAEVIHWHGGATALFDYGALDVREFSSFEVHTTVQCTINVVEYSYGGSQTEVRLKNA